MKHENSINFQSAHYTPGINMLFLKLSIIIDISIIKNKRRRWADLNVQDYNYKHVSDIQADRPDICVCDYFVFVYFLYVCSSYYIFECILLCCDAIYIMKVSLWKRGLGNTANIPQNKKNTFSNRKCTL